MKLGWFTRAAILLIAPLLSVIAAAQSSPPGGTPNGQLDLPSNPQVIGHSDPGIRKATAIVNGEVLTGSDVDQRLALVLASSNAQLPADEVERLHAQVLRNLIDEILEVQEAGRQDINVTPSEVDAYFARIASNFHRTPAQFSAYLRSVGAADTSLKRQVRAELSTQRLQSRIIGPFVSVGDDEVAHVLAVLAASRGTAEYHVGELFMSANPDNSAQVRANLENIVQQIRQGANFQAYARQFSEASTAATGGDLGWVRAPQLPDEISAVITQMPVGAISQPIQVPGGFSVVVLVDKRQILVSDPRDAQLSLVQIALNLPAGTTREQGEARATQLGQATQAMGGCGHAQATAQTLGAEYVINDQVRVRELPPALQQMLLPLSVGQATQPFGSPERISVLVLCGRDDPPPSTGPTADQVYNQMTEERTNRRWQRFLRDLRRDAVVDYR